MAYHHPNDGGVGSGGGGEYSGDELDSRSGGEDRPDSDLRDKPVYLLEHLATFTVNKDSGIVYPADGMRRLLQLEKTTGIWSQKMQLCLDYQWVLIMDYETGNIIERFPATLIQEPTAFTSTDAMELYNNILVFIVSGGSGSRSEMHIFQSQSVSAVHLVEDLKNLRSGKMVPQQREGPLPHSHKSSAGGGSVFTRTMNTSSAMQSRSELQQQQQQQQQQHHHHHHHHYRGGRSSVDQFGVRNAVGLDNSHTAGGGGGGNGETDSDHGGLNDETSSTSSDRYERDVTVLNHCFDDIEKFIARLQHAAAASRELERRRRNRKTKKKDLGEGLLTLRTRPPHEKEFIDIFAKFKLSFNLLAKLKAHIHDPNAPELVHFLFTPLALIVEASSDTYYDSQLPARVINPLLTREAINLLINCVTSKETELWRSLGDAWIIPRDQWKEDVGSYHPVFLDGWSPDYLVIDELETPVTPTNISKRRLETQVHSHAMGHGGAAALNGRISGGPVGDEYDGGVLNEKYSAHYGHAGDERTERLPDNGGVAAVDFGARNDIGYDPMHHHGVGAAGGVQNSGVIQTIAAGIQNLHTRDTRATTMTVGTGGAELSSRSTATADEQMLEAWLEELQASGAKIVLVTYPRTANNDKELSVVRGEYLEILDDTRKWWKARNMRGQVAHVPHTIVTPYNYGDNEPSSAQPSQFYGHHHHQQQQQQQQTNYKQQSRHAANENITDNAEQRTQETTDWVRNKHLALHNFPAAPSTAIGQRPRSSPSMHVTPFAGEQELNYAHRQSDVRGYSECARPVLPRGTSDVPTPPPPSSARSDTLAPTAAVARTTAAKPLCTPLTNNHTSSVDSGHSVYADNCNNNNNTIINNTNVNGDHKTNTVKRHRVEARNSALHRTEINGKNELNAATQLMQSPTPTIYEQQPSSNSTDGGAMREELKFVLRMRERRCDLDIHKTPTVYIEQRSDATKVASWLRAKDFSPAIVQRLAGLTGDQLFALSPEQCEELFGVREGRRLASQLKLQKSVSGYQTARSSELQAVLARARPKYEMQTQP